ncbi:cell division cycle protein 48 [Striga asiatica]|uniref:Cell division cycle protein 48 n=1 Tax=Striga asiatica TaxID=4170 RepID=A0A5A7PPJ0_STRAF|nr:cell division cycle protein 48 [Striga asiatica]
MAMATYCCLCQLSNVFTPVLVNMRKKFLTNPNPNFGSGFWTVVLPDFLVFEFVIRLGVLVVVLMCVRVLYDLKADRLSFVPDDCLKDTGKISFGRGNYVLHLAKFIILIDAALSVQSDAPKASELRAKAEAQLHALRRLRMCFRDICNRVLYDKRFSAFKMDDDAPKCNYPKSYGHVHGMLSQMDLSLVAFCDSIADEGGPVSLTHGCLCCIGCFSEMICFEELVSSKRSDDAEEFGFFSDSVGLSRIMVGLDSSSSSPSLSHPLVEEKQPPKQWCVSSFLMEGLHKSTEQASKREEVLERQRKILE